MVVYYMASDKSVFADWRSNRNNDWYFKTSTHDLNKERV